MPTEAPIGIFDSGVGGLTVLREVVRLLPRENVLYLADTARLPYGQRSAAEIIKYNQEIIPYLIAQGAKMIIMACGTSSALAYPVLKDQYPVPLVSLIEPGARAALAATKNHHLGLLATAGTVNSQAYQKMITSFESTATVVAEACPLFVPFIEGGITEGAEIKKAAKEYLRPLLQAGIDTVILGCTHYPHLTRLLQELAGPEVTLVDPAAATVLVAKKQLEKLRLLRLVGTVKHEFLVTGPTQQFQEVGSRLLGKPITHVKQVKLV